MNNEFTLLLWKTFPNLYQGKDLPITESLVSFGFECSDGWFLIIWNLSEKLEKLGVKATQVKEKYGGLRFYIEEGTDEVFKIIDEAETQSLLTCELTGRPGLLCNKGMWLKTLCKEEAAIHGYTYHE